MLVSHILLLLEHRVRKILADYCTTVAEGEALNELLASKALGKCATVNVAAKIKREKRGSRGK